MRDPTLKVTKDALMRTYEINSVAPLLVAQHFLSVMGKRSRLLYPVIAFVGSKIASVDHHGSDGAFAFAYRSYKSALNSIAKSLSIDLKDQARLLLLLLLLHPEYVTTDMTGGRIHRCK